MILDRPLVGPGTPPNVRGLDWLLLLPDHPDNDLYRLHPMDGPMNGLEGLETLTQDEWLTPSFEGVTWLVDLAGRNRIQAVVIAIEVLIFASWIYDWR